MVRVAIDNDGNIISFNSSVKKIDALTSYPKGSVAPAPKGKAIVKNFGADSEAELEKMFSQELARITGQPSNGKLKTTATKNKKATILEETIGYNLNGGIGAVEAQREYEIDMGKGLKKRYKIRVPIVV